MMYKFLFGSKLSKSDVEIKFRDIIVFVCILMLNLSKEESSVSTISV